MIKSKNKVRRPFSVNKVARSIDDLLYMNSPPSIEEQRVVHLTVLALRHIVRSILREEQAHQSTGFVPAPNSTVYSPSIPTQWREVSPVEQNPLLNRFLGLPAQRPSAAVLARVATPALTNPPGLNYSPFYQVGVDKTT